MVYRGVRACALSYFRNWEPARMEGERERERKKGVERFGYIERVGYLRDERFLTVRGLCRVRRVRENCAITQEWKDIQ